MRKPLLLRAALLVALGGLFLAAAGDAQTIRPKVVRPAPAPKVEEPFVPRFAAMAETRLLMEGLANANYRGINRLLKEKPADAETWAFLRGQALLVAETGNLLLLRPPKNSGRDAWMKLAMDMRTKAGAVARQAAEKDYEGAKKAVGVLTSSCNRCHQTFRVPVKIEPGPEKDRSERDT
jgi:hypothetical protein